MRHALDLALTCIYPRCCCGYCYYFVVMVCTKIVTYVLISVLNVVAGRTPGETFQAPAVPYRAWCRRQLQRRFDAAPDGARLQLEALLRGVGGGCWERLWAV